MKPVLVALRFAFDPLTVAIVEELTTTGLADMAVCQSARLVYGTADDETITKLRDLSTVVAVLEMEKL